MNHLPRAVWVLATLSLLFTACDDGRPDGDGGTSGGDAGEVGSCDPAPLACAETVLEATFPVLEFGRTDRGATDTYSGSTCGVDDMGGMGGGGGLDLAYQFTAPYAGPYEITTEGSQFDTLLSVRTGCEGEEIACSDDTGSSRQSALTVTLEACQTIVIVVDGYDADALGPFRLHVNPRESCGDGMDNDGDGLIDCDDDDCFSLECNGGDDWPMDWQEYEWEVLDLTNQARAVGHNCDTRGEFGPAGPLEMDEVIRIAARAHALDMAEQDYHEHDSLDGRSFSDRMREAGFTGDSPWGENIARNYRTPQQVVDAWLESDGHCANIMNPSYRTIGVGYAYVEGPGSRWCQDFAASH